MIELWPFQQLAVAKILNRPHSVINVAPTGSGKTVIASEVIRRSENSLVLFLAHRRELIHQCQAKLHPDLGWRTQRYNAPGSGGINANPSVTLLAARGGITASAIGDR
jgi:superfamily II DNA or RNA helicase